LLVSEDVLRRAQYQLLHHKGILAPWSNSTEPNTLGRI
jgi:hypothetical protein